MTVSNQSNSQVILVVGGTSGIGLETYKFLKKKGYQVIAAGRNSEQVPSNLNFVKMDVLQEENIKSVFQKIQEEWKHLDGLIYATGMAVPKKNIADFDQIEWSKIYNTNLTGAILCLKYAYSLLKESKGKVALVNSSASRIASRYAGFEYTVSKAALSGLVRQLALD
jgi:NAD(P)-dependent dehydrogenase (short-subunit alcohol dehydrogenase family)